MLEASQDPRTKPMSVRNWFSTIFILAIPIVNIIMILVWAIGSGGNINRKNYCLAVLIWMAIGAGIVLALIVAPAVLRALSYSN